MTNTETITITGDDVMTADDFLAALNTEDEIANPDAGSIRIHTLPCHLSPPIRMLRRMVSAAPKRAQPGREIEILDETELHLERLFAQHTSS